MGFLISHWHCILPIAGIAAAMFFMREKGEGKRDNGVQDVTTAPRNNQD